MGYTTDFSGAFAIEPPLSAEQVAYLQKFSQTRRMKRDVAKLEAMYGEQNPDWPGSGYGVDGEYYVGGTGEHWVSGVETDVIDRNNPPGRQPGLWCQWVPTADGKFLEWDQNEKFYEYVAWLRYMIDNFFSPAGRKLNGTVEFQGESFDDRGAIVVTDNVVEVLEVQYVRKAVQGV